MASEKWAGFTDEDIEKIRNKPVFTDDSDSSLKQSGPLRLTEFSKTKNVDSSAPDNSIYHHNSKGKTQFLTSNWKINKSNIESSASVESLNNCTCELSNSESYVADLSDESCESNTVSHNEERALSDRSFGSNADIQELEVFEIRQRRIEAENAKRRALITKAIMDKKKRTQAEAVKLKHITDELNHLDSMLSGDVSILRDYIEKASMEFSEAEKRYLKAEKEFIDAKLLLFEKMQRKEQLTEHLCAIIEQNENRKANKLVELMKQLEMETIIENFETLETQPILSKYCIMNDEAYHCCQTLKPTQNASASQSQIPEVNIETNECEDLKPGDNEEIKIDQGNST